MQDRESVVEMFHCLNIIVNELRALGFKVDVEDFSHKMSSRLKIIVTIFLED